MNSNLDNITREDLEKAVGIASASAGLATVLFPPVRRFFTSVIGALVKFAAFPVRLVNTVDRLGAAVSSLEALINKTNDLAYLSSSKAQFALEQLSVPTFECDAEGKCVWTNEALCTLFGLTQAETLGDGWLNALHPEDIPRVASHWRKTVNHWTPYRVRYRILTENREAVLVEATASIILNPNTNKILAIRGQVVPVKE